MNSFLMVETVMPGAAPAFLAAVKSPGRARAQGTWGSEFGPLNQVVSLHEANGAETPPAEITSLNGEAAALLQQREIRLLAPAKPYRADPNGGGFYELREYSVAPGTAPIFIEAMKKVMPVREKHSPNLAIWTPLTGSPDRIVHLWAYRDLAHRMEARAGVAKEPEWKAYLDKIMPLLRHMTSTLLMPVKA